MVGVLLLTVVLVLPPKAVACAPVLVPPTAMLPPSAERFPVAVSAPNKALGEISPAVPKQPAQHNTVRPKASTNRLVNMDFEVRFIDRTIAKFLHVG